MTTHAIALVVLLCALLCAGGARGFQFSAAAPRTTRRSSSTAQYWNPPTTTGSTLTHRRARHLPARLRAPPSDDVDEDSGSPSSEMEAMILSLSREPTDDARRERLTSIFAAELVSKPDDAADGGGGKKFVDDFGAALQKVGTEVQIAAREKALRKQQEQQTGDESGDEDGEGDEGGGDETEAEAPAASASASTSTSEGTESKREGEDGEVEVEEQEQEQDYMNSGDKSDDEKQLWALVDMMIQSKTLVKKAEGSLGSEGAFS